MWRRVLALFLPPEASLQPLTSLSISLVPYVPMYMILMYIPIYRHSLSADGYVQNFAFPAPAPFNRMDSRGPHGPSAALEWKPVKKCRRGTFGQLKKGYHPHGMTTNENLEILFCFRFRTGKASKFPLIFFCICFCNDHVGCAQATTAGHAYEIN